MNSKKSEKIMESKFTYKDPRKNKLGLPAYPDKLQ